MRFAAPGRRQSIELAGTTPAAVAADHFFTCDPPLDVRRFAHFFSFITCLLLIRECHVEVGMLKAD